MRGLSEAVTEMLMIAIVLLAMGIVLVYYFHENNVQNSVEYKEARQQILESGQQIALVYYYTTYGSGGGSSSGGTVNSVYVVENIGNIPITVCCILNVECTNCATSSAEDVKVSYSIINMCTKSSTNIIEPHHLYEIIVDGNSSEIVIKTNCDNYIKVIA
jgi:hypothetical protein